MRVPVAEKSVWAHAPYVAAWLLVASSCCSHCRGPKQVPLPPGAGAAGTGANVAADAAPRHLPHTHVHARGHTRSAGLCVTKMKIWLSSERLMHWSVLQLATAGCAALLFAAAPNGA
jgi:hypothetical protein